MEPDRRSDRLDAVRGIAILLVLTGHYFAPAVARRLGLGDFAGMLWVGVDLFFVLSGFLLGGVLLKNRAADSYFLPFYGRRALRILPLYAVCVGLFMLTEDARTQSIWPLALFGQNIEWAINNQWGPLSIAPTWSLAVEEQFYLVLPLLIRYCPQRRLPMVLLALICAAPFVRLLLQSFGYSQATYYLMPARMDALFFGVLLAWAVAQPRSLNRRYLRIAAVAGGLGFLALLMAQLDPRSWWMSVVGYSVVAVFFSACFALLVTSRHFRHERIVGMLAPFGLGAYSIYLFHMPILIAITAYMGPSKTALASSTAIVLAVAWVCWRWIEKPCIAFGHRIFPYLYGSNSSFAFPSSGPSMHGPQKSGALVGG
jgi:peptidoglycan/LPS O-acetylase OafA/YrhL